MLNRREILSSLLSLPLGLAASSLPAVAQSSSGDLPLRLGVVPVDQFAEGYYAAEMGFFKAAGLNVEIIPIATGAQVSAAIVGGSIDIGITNTGGLANAVAHGAPFVIVAGAGLSDASAQLCVAKNSPLKTARELEGKTISVETLRDLTQIAPSAWLEQSGVDYRKVRFIEIHFAEVAAALDRGTVDAGMLTEPFLSAANGSTIRILANVYTAIAPLFLVSAWFTTRDYVAKNPEPVRRFVAAMGDTARWANANRDRSAEILAKNTKLSLSTIKGMSRTSYVTAVEPKYLQPLLTQLYKFHAIDKPLTVADVALPVKG